MTTNPPTMYITRDNAEDLHVAVEGTAIPGEFGSRGPYGEPLEPDTQESVEDITAVVLEPLGPYKSGETIELTLDESLEAERLILEQLKRERDEY